MTTTNHLPADLTPPNVVLTFGKHSGCGVHTVAQTDPMYLRWLIALPVVRQNKALYASLRHVLLAQLQAELAAELAAAVVDDDEPIA